MLPASNKGAGMNIGFPDVCLTPAPPAPPIPIPYPNMALHAIAVPFSISVKVSMLNALNIGAEVPLTMGDEAGVAHFTIKGPGRYTLGNLVVLVEGLPAVNLTTPTTGNNMNNPAGAVLVPAVTNVFFSHGGEAAPPPAGAGAPPPIDVAQMTRLGDALAPPLGGEDEVALLPGGVACLAIPIFDPGVPSRVYSAARRLLVEGLTALILDLRGCPGGDAMAALDLAGDFLDEGAALAAATDGDGDETVYRARGPRLYAFPLFLLVDRRTASAAELFAGALQAHRRAVVVGERTYGKGTAQSLVPGVAQPGASYATVATFVLPGGQPLDGHGVVPDLDIPPDGALDAAHAAITSLLSSKEVR